MSSSEPTFVREALPHDVEPFKRAAQSNDQSAFMQQVPSPVLLYQRSDLWDAKLVAPEDPDRGGGTQTVRYDWVKGGMVFLSHVRKRQTSPDDPNIFLGRAISNDIIVPVASVSSGHLLLTPPAGQHGEWRMTDRGSSNGTWLDERQVAEDAPEEIRSGDCIRLGGNLIAYFFHPTELWKVLTDEVRMQQFTEL